MAKVVRCEDCGKLYNYDEDAFCPKCGAFNQPSWRGRGGAPRRVDGINEAGHAHSFVHQEFHRENRERRHTDLVKNNSKQDYTRTQGGSSAEDEERQESVPTTVQAQRTRYNAQRKQKQEKSIGQTVLWIVVFLSIILFSRACSGR